MIKRTRDQGIAILTVVIAVVIIGGISSAFFLLSMNESQNTERLRYKARATYLAEAGAEIAANVLRQAIANNPAIMSDPAVLPSATPIGTMVVNQVVLINGYPVQCKAVKRQIINIPTGPSALHVSNATFELMGYAEVGANTTRNHSNTSQGAVVYKMVQTTGTPLFQFLAFYQGDMEINPGPYAHLHGRLHTNSAMYLTDRSANGLVLDSDHVQAVGGFARQYSQTTSSGTFSATAVETGATGPVYVRNMGTTPMSDAVIDANPTNDPGLVAWALGLNSASGVPNPTAPGVFASTAQANWNGTVLDGSMGAQTMVAPQLQSIQPGGFYDQQARSNGLEIVDGVVKQNGVDVTSAINSAQPGAITSSSLYDTRQGTSVPVVTVDVGKLQKTAYWPSNGILYATSSTATAASPQGIQLVNGSYIAPPSNGGAAGFTVASTLPVYVKGDYNGTTDTTGLSMMRTDNSTNPPTRYSQTINPSTGAAVDTMPCAIMADAINLLSNAYVNTTGPGMGTATNTTYNAAMVAGDQLTAANGSSPDNGYNGGLQNLPRFLENWGGVKCNIAGSFVNLWQSQIATGAYGQANVYVPPERHWDFDQHFNTPGGTPPGSPFAISISRTTYEEGAVRGMIGGVLYDLHPD